MSILERFRVWRKRNQKKPKIWLVAPGKDWDFSSMESLYKSMEEAFYE